MRSSWIVFCLPLLCVAQPRQADVVIYGATSAGIAAAVQVSRMGKSVLIVDPGTHLGGLTTGGLGWTDIGNKQVIGGIAREFYSKVKAHYDKPDSWKFQPRASYYSLRHAEINAADDAMWTFEPRVATAIYQEMIAQFKIPVVMKQRLDLRPGKGVLKSGTRITAIVMEDGTRYN
jgi:predicted NAD/FAD-dependent oxidoreductase